MPFKDILVYADRGSAASARVEFAAAIAAAHGAHLTALHVAATPTMAGFVLAELPQLVLDLQEKMIREDIAKLEGTVQEAGTRAGVEIEWRVGRGIVEQLALDYARHVDLAIVGQASDDPTEATRGDRLAEALVLGSGRPTLVVPRFGRFGVPGKRVLAAWNGTREAARAINDALPFLEGAQKVTVLTINPRDRSVRSVPGADISIHLARHGVKVEAATNFADDMDVGDLLLSRASDLGADLIVMGAYGHSRMREMVLGGATRHLLRHMTVPVLLAH